jgi:uncharacterized tellurite resistance protein B-like protein
LHGHARCRQAAFPRLRARADGATLRASPHLPPLPMLPSIIDFFERRLRPAGAVGDEAARVRLATAALLAEMVRIDRDVTPDEQAIALRAVRDKFGLPAAEAEELLALAETEARQATDYYQFTSLINREFTQPQKERVIELLWQVAYADDELSAHELHLMRKVAGLLHVPDSAYIAAKMRAKAAVGG